ncbi:N-formylglutamate amidohydrolase [Sphingomonas aerolata]|uniref:N-formylglutamate amidohydrolase n=1 Tax=Sphingomonas aerolata TaxID=185951 RepID=UPI002FDF996A
MAQPQPSAKLRSGLGLVPRRAAAAPDLWRRRFTDADISSRIANDHRPYHDAVHDALAAAQAKFGIAILLDVHSMPPLSAAGVPGGSPPRIVLGDRFGRSADPRFLARLETEIADTGLPFARNAPYAGGISSNGTRAPLRGSTRSSSNSIGRSIWIASSTGWAPAWMRRCGCSRPFSRP